MCKREEIFFTKSAKNQIDRIFFAICSPSADEKCFLLFRSSLVTHKFHKSISFLFSFITAFGANLIPSLRIFSESILHRLP